MTFRELDLNKPFTIYHRLSSKRYEEREAVVLEKEETYMTIHMLSRNGKFYSGNYASSWFWAKGEGMDSDKYPHDTDDPLFTLIKPEGKTIVKTKRVIEII